jgi:uncharacterized membrane protein
MFGWLRFLFILGPWVALAATLFLVGIVLVLLGFDLARVDDWLAGHSSWFTATGDVLLRIVCLVVLLVCGLAVLSPVIDRKNPERLGYGCAFLALIVGYFAFAGLFLRY